mgnify:FL=1
MKKNSSFTLRSGNKPSFAKLSGVQKSPMKEVPQSEEQKARPKTRQENKEDQEARNEKIMFDSNATADQRKAARLRQKMQMGTFLTEEEKKFLREFDKKKASSNKMKKSPAKNLSDDKKKKEKPNRRSVMNKLYKECAAGDRMACITLKYMQGQKLTQEEKDFANDPKNRKKKTETK